jgi:hypothetical protein
VRELDIKAGTFLQVHYIVSIITAALYMTRNVASFVITIFFAAAS